METEKTKVIDCSGCGMLLDISATHTYGIIQRTPGSFYKEDGIVVYKCIRCGYELSVSEIEPVLKQVDEL